MAELTAIKIIISYEKNFEILFNQKEYPHFCDNIFYLP